METAALIEMIAEVGYKVRMKVRNYPENEYWSNWAIIPVPGYIELGGPGPWPVREVEWLEINPTVIEQIGKLVKPKVYNHLIDITLQLASKGIDYSILGEVIRIPFSQFNK